MSYDDIENATPDIVIGSTIEEPEEDYQVESDNELQAADHESSQINEESAKGKSQLHLLDWMKTRKMQRNWPERSLKKVVDCLNNQKTQISMS